MRKHMLVILCFLLTSLSATEVRILTLDNQVYSGIVGAISSSSIALASEKNQKNIDFLDIIEVVCQDRVDDELAPHCIFLHDGSCIRGEITEGDAQSLTIQSSLLGLLAVDLLRIAEVRFDNSSVDTEETDTGNDVVYFREGDIMNCMVDSFGKGYVQVQHQQLGARKEYFDKIRRIRFTRLENTAAKSDKLVAIVLGTDESKIYGEISGGDEQQLFFVPAGQQRNISLPLSRIQRFFFTNGRFIYLSDLPRDNYRMVYTPAFPGPEKPMLARLDKNQRGDMLQLGKQVFYKGIGVISRTEIIVDLGKKYQRFQSSIGVDEQVQKIARQNSYVIGGSVVFQIFVDNQKKYDSSVIRWDDEPKTVDIDVKGKNTMRLMVDFAENAHVNDLADWAGARLIKSPSEK